LPPGATQALSDERSLMANTKQILIVDDDEALRGSLAEQLELHEGFAEIGRASCRERVSVYV
jgi:hypothetical protein